MGCRDGFAFVATGATSEVLAEAFARTLGHIFPPMSRKHAAGVVAPALAAELNVLAVNVLSADMALRSGVDESYTLSITEASGSVLTAPTVWGALHGLETFAQLVQRVSASQGVIEGLPILIEVR